MYIYIYICTSPDNGDSLRLCRRIKSLGMLLSLNRNCTNSTVPGRGALAQQTAATRPAAPTHRVPGPPETHRHTVESIEGISEIWLSEPFPRWGFLRFRVRVRFTYG